MIYTHDGRVTAAGEPVDILADLGVAAESIAKDFGKDLVLNSVLLGLYGETDEDMDKIDDMMRSCGFNV